MNQIEAHGCKFEAHQKCVTMGLHSGFEKQTLLSFYNLQ